MVKHIKSFRIYYISLGIILASFLNFQYNFFKVVSDERFNYFQVESEQFVLDGYLNHTINDGPLKLGQFSRPSIDMFNDGEKYKPREWYINEFIEGDFWEYKSHFGLQMYIYKLFNGRMILVQLLASLVLSIVIGFIFFYLLNTFSLQFSLIFILTLIFNPWITPIARNSYFLVFIYFIPFLISLIFARKINKSTKSLSVMLIVFYIIFLFKSLIGYDYLSTIVLTSMIPIVYYSLKNNLHKLILLKHLSLIVFVSILSFSTAVLVHANSLDNEKNPFEWIYYAAAKRMSSSSPEKIAYEACFELLADKYGNFDMNELDNKDCYDEFLESLSASRLTVMSKYLLARHMIPFFGSFEISLRESQEKELKQIYYNSNFNSVQKGQEAAFYFFNNIRDFNLFQVFSVLVNFIISPIFFIILLIVFTFKTLKSNSKTRFFNFFILLPPLSWFLLAKGHSYVTAYQLTFFIWFIPTVPYIVAMVFSKDSLLNN